MNERLGIIEERQAWTNHVLSTARMSSAARARAMGKKFYCAPKVTWVIPDQPKIEAQPRDMRRKRLRGKKAKIFDAVAEAFNVTFYELLDAARPQRLARPRFAVALLMRGELKMSFPQIGRATKRDHSSAIRAVRRGAELLFTDPEWAERYHAAERLLKGDE